MVSRKAAALICECCPKGLGGRGWSGTQSAGDVLPTLLP